MHQLYAGYVSRNSCQFISVTGKSNSVISSFVTPLLTLIVSSLIMLAILAALLVVDPVVSVVAFVGFGAIYGVVILVTRKRLAANSHRVADKGDRKSTRLNSSH